MDDSTLKQKNLNIDELIKAIKDKGISINNEEYVRDILKQNNYYVINDIIKTEDLVKEIQNI